LFVSVPKVIGLQVAKRVHARFAVFFSFMMVNYSLDNLNQQEDWNKTIKLFEGS